MNRKLFQLTFIAIAAFALFAVACGDDDDDGGDGGGGNTLQEVIDRDSLLCGVKDSQPGFGFLDGDTYSGNDIEFCKAVAAAILGDSSKVEYVPASAQDRFELLSSGEIDVLIRTTTWTATRDAENGGDFTSTTFYDGQGMLVRDDSGFETLEDLDGATICVTGGTTTESNLAARFNAGGLEFTPLTFESDTEILTAFAEGRCDGWTADKGNLAGQRANFPESEGGPEAVRVLAETFSKEPLGPVTRDNDTEFHDVVQWVVFGMIAAEEAGITSENVADMAANPPNIDVARILGVGFEDADPAEFGLGVEVDFMQDVLSQVGNFGEVYERTIEPIGLAREGSLNALWTEGGLIYSPPMR